MGSDEVLVSCQVYYVTHIVRKVQEVNLTKVKQRSLFNVDNIILSQYYFFGIFEEALTIRGYQVNFILITR